MTIWAIADLHLSLGVQNKKMDIFGSEWTQHHKKIESHWCKKIKNDDLVLIAGDISWAMHLSDALVDLEWIHSLPGTKIMIKGNHDFWWSSHKKMNAIKPPSIHFIYNNAFNWNDITVAGARLWDSPEYHFNDFINFKENSLTNKAPKKSDGSIEEAEKIFLRDFNRLETSLQAMSKKASIRLVMTHYPPISADLKNSRVSELLEKYHVNHCIFGHLHSLKPGLELFGEKNGINYYLTACDYLNFDPIKIL